MRVTWMGPIVLVVTLSGCPLTHERGGDSGTSYATDARVVGPDAGTPRDAGAPSDAGTPRDAGTPSDAAHAVDAVIVTIRDGGRGRCRVDATPRPGFGQPTAQFSELDPTTLHQSSLAANIRLIDVRVLPAAPAGDYTVLARDGTITLRRAGSVVATTNYDPSTRLGANVTFTLVDIVELTVGAGAASGPPLAGALVDLPQLFDGRLPLRIDPPAVIREGLACRGFVVHRITLDDAVEPGDYVCGIPPGSPHDWPVGRIECRRDGTVATSTTYVWQTIVGTDDAGYGFEFPASFTIVLSSPVGTRSLWNAEDSIFEGRSVLRIACD